VRSELMVTMAARDGARADLEAARTAAAAAREAAGSTAEGLALEQAAAASLTAQLQHQVDNRSVMTAFIINHALHMLLL
jgi:hypothetical protein